MKLNLGCGNDIREGWINLDRAALPGIDVVHDMNELPLPFEKEQFTEILCQDVLEHLDYIPVLEDLHRILRKKGVLCIRVPHFTSRFSYIDPTHQKLFSVQTFDFFTRNTLSGAKRGEYYFDFQFEYIQYRRITLERGIFFYNYPLEPLINLNRFTQIVYEASGLSRIFPAENILIELIK